MARAALGQIDSIHFLGPIDSWQSPWSCLASRLPRSVDVLLPVPYARDRQHIDHLPPPSRIRACGRAWMAIREDEIAAKAMGLNTRNLKLLAFGMGATFGGVAGSMFAGSFQGFISPESFTLMESIMIVAMVVLGGVGHLPGVILGAVLLSALPEVLRYVAGPLQSLTGGRLDASILRQLLIALAMISIMLIRPQGLVALA
jgi:ABC-type branched-subunit amino acid transport system permease subunit